MAQARFDRALMAAVERLVTTDEQRRRLLRIEGRAQQRLLGSILRVPSGTTRRSYLSGGTNFGAVGPPTGPNGYAGPDIITRNLTPDHTGLPEGGHTFSEFLNILRTGHDYDQLHLNCSATVTDNCYFATSGNEIDGALLQIMPWPTFSHMSDNDIQAIYEYLRAVPCNANSSSPYPWVRNVC